MQLFLSILCNFAIRKDYKMIISMYNDQREEFVKEISQHTEAAYKKLYDGYFRALVVYADRVLADIEQSTDVVQGVFAEMWENRVVFSSYSAFQVYIYRIVHNKSVNLLRHKKVELNFVQQKFVSKEINTETDIIRAETYRLLYAAIDRLTPRQREIFMLRMEGKNAVEIGALLNLSVATIRTQNKLAMARLRKMLGKDFYLLFPFVTLL